jgi:hypothetical protein
MVMEVPANSFWVIEHADMKVLSVCLNINLAWKFGRAIVDLFPPPMLRTYRKGCIGEAGGLALSKRTPDIHSF